MVTLTERAAKEVKTIISEQDETAEKRGEEPQPHYLRLGVKGGGCSGFEYVMDLSNAKGEMDECWEQHGVQLICDPKSLLYLDGVTVDFKDEMMGRGFTFNNPNASSSCGCGSSFSA